MRANMESVRASLEYLRSAPRKPVTNMLAAPDEHSGENSDSVSQVVTIRNGRADLHPTSLDREGFVLSHAPSSLPAFTDHEAIKRLYYPEMQELARALTGARHAIVFDHVLRKRAPGAVAPFGDRQGHRPSAAMRVHCDFTPASASRRLSLELGALGVDHVPRFAIINLWRSTALPVLDAPLAVCDARSVRQANLVAADIVYPDRTGEIYQVLHHPDHRWTYFHAMEFHEVLVFKQYDSASNVARYTPHAAFAHPDTPVCTPPRESVEIRCLLIFD